MWIRRRERWGCTRYVVPINAPLIAAFGGLSRGRYETREKVGENVGGVPYIE